MQDNAARSFLSNGIDEMSAGRLHGRHLIKSLNAFLACCPVHARLIVNVNIGILIS